MDALTCGLAWWRYWDRDGALHAVTTSPDCAQPAPLPFVLTQQQVDDLVVASMPDHLLYYVDLNQRHLLDRITGEKSYYFVRRAYVEARGYGITGLQDLVNFVCAKLNYGASVDTDPHIGRLMQRVAERELSFTRAMREMP